MDKKQQFVEEVGLYFERVGLTRMEGRIIGWLLICDPPHQSMGDLVEALGASKSSISVSLRTLTTLYLIDQVSIPGERRDYYKASTDLWNRSFRARLHQVTELRQLAERGIDLLADETPEQRRRLELMRDYNAFMEQEFPKLLDKWDEIKKARGYDAL
ncbi:MAG TPA: MarR family transcriptional regulator [Oceanobacillus sp.]|nr:MarR family transcriptional regulator [Oceanobacillus sp.]